MNQSVTVGVKQITLGQKVIRCGCTPEQKLAPDWHARVGAHCPNPLDTEDLGVVAMWNRNPLRVLAWRMGQWMRGRKPGSVAMKTQE